MEMFPSFDVHMPSIIQLIKEKEYNTILLQVPEGMKRGAVAFAAIIEKETGASTLVDGELCYGACDHAGTRAKLLDIDAVIHLGHSDIPSMKSECSLPVHFFHAPMKLPVGMIEKGLEQILGSDGSETFGLAAPVQHVDHLAFVKEFLEEKGRQAKIGDPTPREELPGQVLGCSFGSSRNISNQVDSFIYLGTGRFHPLGMVSAVGKQIWSLDPMTGEIVSYGKNDLDSFLRKRFAAITKAEELLKKGNRIGIVLGTKPGQSRKELAERIDHHCKRKNADRTIVVMDYIDPMKLRSLGIDIAVITACPRIAYDDISRYNDESVLVITGIEMEIALGVRKWESYSFDEEW